MSGVEVVRVSERALLARFHDAELEVAVAKAQALFSEARSERLSLKGRDGELLGPSRLALGAGSLLFELPPKAEGGGLERIERRLAQLAREIDAREANARVAPDGREHRVEVRFGGEAGPDLEAVARETRASPERVIELLTAAELRVAFVGFAPGFPYLIGLPPELQVPRLASPRSRVPAGSVAIAGPFAGVYPSATPGGWRLLGLLAPEESALFDPRRDPPARFAPGDCVRFVARPDGG